MSFEELKSRMEEHESSSDLYVPTQEDFEQLSIEELHEFWRENHEKLKKLLIGINS